jgi:uncharacterized protein
LGRLIFIFVIGLIIYWIIRAYVRRVPREDAESQARVGEDMVRCSHCGVHLPRSESILAEGKFYCSEEHRRLS